MDEFVFVEWTQASTSISETDLIGFFEGWARRPSAAVLRSILTGSYCSFVARAHGGRVVGVVSAISDGVLSAYVPLLEVLPEFRRQGIGSHLMQLVLDRLEGLYMVDVTCDEVLIPFYGRFGMKQGSAMSIRRPRSIPST